MSTVNCPGQDTQKWGPEAVYDVACKSCGDQLEFFKDELKGCASQLRQPSRGLRPEQDYASGVRETVVQNAARARARVETVAIDLEPERTHLCCDGALPYSHRLHAPRRPGGM